MSRHDAFRAALLGHAIGDALGVPVEGWSRQRILRHYGPDGIRGFEPGDGLPKGSWTDDTQMMLATAEGLLDFARESRTRPVCDPAESVYERYVEWRRSLAEPGRWRRPGATCLGALESGSMGTPEDPLNDRKGAGGIMRIAPAGLAFPPERAFEMAAEFAAITHGHPTGWLAAGFYADVLSRIVDGAPLAEAIAATRELLLGWDDLDETLEKVDQAVELFMCDADLDQGFELLGEGWIAEEALGISLFCALNFPDHFREGVLTSVNITGDSDTTGCLTGTLLGAMLGTDAIPAKWAAGVEDADGILDTADRLWDAYGGTR